MKTFYIILFVTAAIAMPLWMAWCRAHKRPYLRYWLGSLLLGTPILAVRIIWPELLEAGASLFILQLTILPLFVGISAFVGGMVFQLLTININVSNHQRASGSRKRRNDINQYYEPETKSPYEYHWDWRW